MQSRPAPLLIGRRAGRDHDRDHVVVAKLVDRNNRGAIGTLLKSPHLCAALRGGVQQLPAVLLHAGNVKVANQFERHVAGKAVQIHALADGAVQIAIIVWEDGDIFWQTINRDKWGELCAGLRQRIRIGSGGRDDGCFRGEGRREVGLVGNMDSGGCGWILLVRAQVARKKHHSHRDQADQQQADGPAAN